MKRVKCAKCPAPILNLPAFPVGRCTGETMFDMLHRVKAIARLVLSLSCLLLLLLAPSSVQGDDSLEPGIHAFETTVQPFLAEYCYACHADGMNEGSVTLDHFPTPKEAVEDVDLWWRVLKMLRAGLMPPQEMFQPSPEEQEAIEQWIKFTVFQIDPLHPDPGNVTLRRLNRIEYRNTVRDLLGVDYKTHEDFPADDTGEGFDNLGEVLTISPLLMEKYLEAARKIVAEAIPLDPEQQQQSKSFARFFTREIPEDEVERLRYARELLGRFAGEAFRRPADDETINRLADFAEQFYSQEHVTFVEGVAEAMTAILASPRFLFREETPELAASDGGFPHVDEYSLASRLSYFLWSTMPDEELLRLAGEGELRKNLGPQLERMLADSKSQQFIHNFVGQWLQVRDLESLSINTAAVMMREEVPDPEQEALRRRFRELRQRPAESLSREERSELREARSQFFASFRRFDEYNLDGELRRAMRRETELVFEHILHNDRSLLELLDSDYTFLNERLAKHYGMEGVEGQEMRLVELPEGSPRGGVLTQGTVLTVTSNPDRTSPVKRGLFILENLLGTPPPPAPPDVPSLEAAGTREQRQTLTIRDAMEIHREDPLCHSCHARMDPLGLALENFNALGIWRDSERGQPVETGGELLTGESFTNVVELKEILAGEHAIEFYRCLTEKMLTYALGRGLDYYDVETVDQIVDRINTNDGRISALISGVVESAAFQKCRPPAQHDESDDTQTAFHGRRY